MKQLFSTNYSTGLLHFWLLINRIAVSAFMLTHGLPKLYRFFGDGDIRFADPLGIGVLPSLASAVFAEVICSILIIIGFGTRLATIPLIITMAVAVFMVHAADPFQRMELGLMYLFAFMTILVLFTHFPCKNRSDRHRPCLGITNVLLPGCSTYQSKGQAGKGQSFCKFCLQAFA